MNSPGHSRDPEHRDADTFAAPGSGEHPFDWPMRSGAVDDVLREMKIRLAARRRRKLGLVAITAAAVLTAGVATRMTWHAESSQEIAALSPSPIILHAARQELNDGSVVELKPGAQIIVEFSDSLRRVILEQGEAHFDVTKNPQRPFVVVAGAVEFRAVGTAFSVERSSAAVELLVTEGRVAVENPSTLRVATAGSPPGARSEPLALVDAGNRLTVTAQFTERSAPLRVEPVAAAQVAARMAWRVPKLELSGTRLGEVLPLFNRYGQVKLVLGDSDLGRLQLSGVLRADNVDTLLGLLQDTYGVKGEENAEGEIVLRRRR
jgi:transmembrane sensor